MGRTTDTFINDVNTLTAACVAPLNQMVQAAAAFARERTAYQALVSQSAARVTALTGDMQWSAGGAPAKYGAAGGLSSEDYITRDPAFRQLDQQMQARQGQLTAAMQAVTAARTALRTPYGSLKTKVTAFETYIKAKKASTKNPFKKKSVGHAETVIAQAKAFLTACETAARPN